MSFMRILIIYNLMVGLVSSKSLRFLFCTREQACKTLTYIHSHTWDEIVFPFLTTASVHNSAKSDLTGSRPGFFVSDVNNKIDELKWDEIRLTWWISSEWGANRKKMSFYYCCIWATATFKAPQRCFCFVNGFMSFFLCFYLSGHCHSFKNFLCVFVTWAEVGRVCDYVLFVLSHAEEDL